MLRSTSNRMAAGMEHGGPPAFGLRGVRQLKGGHGGSGRPRPRDPAARLTALVGSSGAGKTSLLRLLNRLDEPDPGDDRVPGPPGPRDAGAATPAQGRLRLPGAGDVPGNGARQPPRRRLGLSDPPVDDVEGEDAGARWRSRSSTLRVAGPRGRSAFPGPEAAGEPRPRADERTRGAADGRAHLRARPRDGGSADGYRAAHEHGSGRSPSSWSRTGSPRRSG
jgi:hypothetical protein